MYKIYADGTLIYDSTVEDYKIGSGTGSLEVNKSGTFTFSLYPGHFYYDKIVKLKTVVIVKKSDRIIFRGRVLDDHVDYWNRKVMTCEGEMGFLQDSIIRPFTFSGTPEELFYKYVNDHNAQVDEYKRFKVGDVTVLDPNNYIARSNSGYENTLSNLNSRLIEDSLGGYFHITHGADGMDPVPTLHYLSDFTRISTQLIEFGANLKDYVKKSSAQEIATAIIPLGTEIDDGNIDTDNPRLTIESVNDGVDYVYDEAAVAAYGWVFRVVEWDDVTEPENLKTKALKYLEDCVKESVTLELNAIDLHLLDRNIESFQLGDYVRVVSAPHKFAETLLCYKQTFDILKPQNDTITLGRVYASFAESTARAAALSSTVSTVKKDVIHLNKKTNEYKMAEQQLTALMAQSFGVFRTEDVLADGSTVYYMHDKPTLDESTNIWKMTGDAFAVSSDGGKTWSAGLDASGNAVMNILSVIGIEASWINADNLTALIAKLGPWNIDNKYGLWCELPDSSGDGTKWRIQITPPTSEDDSFIMCTQIDKEGWFVPDTGCSIQSNGNAIFDGSVWIGSVQNLNMLQHAWVSNEVIGFQDGVRSNWTHNVTCGMFRTANGGSFQFQDNNGNILAYFNPTGNSSLGVQLGCDTVYGKTWVQGAQLYAGNGVSTSISLGFPSGTIVLVFQAGILVNAYYA